MVATEHGYWQWRRVCWRTSRAVPFREMVACRLYELKEEAARTSSALKRMSTALTPVAVQLRDAFANLGDSARAATITMAELRNVLARQRPSGRR